jgi:hypothetical protein
MPATSDACPMQPGRDVSPPERCGRRVGAALSPIAPRRCAVRCGAERRAKAKGFVAPSPDGHGTALYRARRCVRPAECGRRGSAQKRVSGYRIARAFFLGRALRVPPWTFPRIRRGWPRDDTIITVSPDSSRAAGRVSRPAPHMSIDQFASAAVTGLQIYAVETAANFIRDH